MAEARVDLRVSAPVGDEGPAELLDVAPRTGSDTERRKRDTSADDSGSNSRRGRKGSAAATDRDPPSRTPSCGKSGKQLGSGGGGNPNSTSTSGGGNVRKPVGRSATGGLAGCAPSWADGTWHPMAVTVSTGQIKNNGTGVFIPPGMRLPTASSSGSSGSGTAAGSSSISSSGMSVHGSGGPGSPQGSPHSPASPATAGGSVSKPTSNTAAAAAAAKQHDNAMAAAAGRGASLSGSYLLSPAHASASFTAINGAGNVGSFPACVSAGANLMPVNSGAMANAGYDGSGQYATLYTSAANNARLGSLDLRSQNGGGFVSGQHLLPMRRTSDNSNLMGPPGLGNNAPINHAANAANAAAAAAAAVDAAAQALAAAQAAASAAGGSGGMGAADTLSMQLAMLQLQQQQSQLQQLQQQADLQQQLAVMQQDSLLQQLMAANGCSNDGAMLSCAGMPSTGMNVVPVSGALAGNDNTGVGMWSTSGGNFLPGYSMVDAAGNGLSTSGFSAFGAQGLGYASAGRTLLPLDGYTQSAPAADYAPLPPGGTSLSAPTNLSTPAMGGMGGALTTIDEQAGIGTFNLRGPPGYMGRW